MHHVIFTWQNIAYLNILAHSLATILFAPLFFLMHKYSNVQNKQPMSHSVILVHLAEGQPIKKGEGQVVLAGSMMSVTLPPAETASDNKYLAAATHRLTCLCGG